MTENTMQCCYTNAVQEVGGKISSGWQPVAVSDNIPSEAYNGCISLQNANATIQAPMVDERGNVLNLYEITGDGSFVYVSRTQYGLVDRLGRPNMFSHAYIFSWKKEDVLGDPNTFLTIDRSNFAEDEQTASTQKTQLNRDAALTLEQAMRTAGLTPETYLTLIQCVYCQFSERKAAKPLFVQFDGSEEQMQAILYCIYFGLPHYVRKSLSIASAISNTSDSKNIIFSEFASKHETYIIPQTGENNLLTQRAERKIARLGFPDFAVRNCTSIDARQYFAQLDTDRSNIRQLGGGWVAEETLAIAIYCALRYEHDFSAGIIAAVNHDGDSDSTGAVTGNILGAINGYDSIEAKWKNNLELMDVLLEMSDDLCHGCLMSEYDTYYDPDWARKYIEAHWEPER